MVDQALTPALGVRIGMALRTAVAAEDELNIGACWAFAHAGAAILRARVGGDWQVVTGYLACGLLDMRRVYSVLGLFEGLSLTPRDGTTAELNWIVGPPGIVDFYAFRYPAIALQTGVALPPMPPVIWGDVPPFLSYTPHAALTRISHSYAQKYHVFLQALIGRALIELGAAHVHIE